jgi:hypothetical protein
MSKLVKTIFDTCIAKIDEKERTSILDKLYAESNNTRAVFLAQAEEVAKTTFEAKESLAKIFSFAEFLKSKEAPFRYSGIVWQNVQTIEEAEKKVEGVVYAKNKHDAFLQIEEQYQMFAHCYEDDFAIEEISVKQANKEREAA